MVKDRGEIKEFQEKLLGWYDEHRRVLPWRAVGGEMSDPYRVWLSEVMLQQTTVAAVIPYFQKFTEKWPTVFDLAGAPEDEVMQAWAGLGYYARARNLVKCARVVVAEHKGVFPKDIVGLRMLPGIGEYTSAAIHAIAFGQEANVVDGNVERVMARVHAVAGIMPKAKPILKQLAGDYAQGVGYRAGDYAQALMDLGATICTPKSPMCALCPVRDLCKAHAQGRAADYPVKAPKALKPEKMANVFWIENEAEEILVERRPPKGLLGGMIGLPTSEWVGLDVYSQNDQPENLRIQNVGELEGVVKHSFTHFNLTLRILRGRLYGIPCQSSYWHRLEDSDIQGFPTLFKKVLKLYNR